jgi:predicted lipopolysaccharide heptosyltransferase III
MNNILVIKLRYIGDVLLATPALEALRFAYPATRLTMLVNCGTEEVLFANPNLDQTMVLDRGSLLVQARFVRDLRRRRFDLVIDLTDADRSAFMTWASGAPLRIGFNDEQRLRGRCYTTVVRADSGSHRIERDLAALKPLGIKAGAKLPRLWLTGADEQQAEALLDRLAVRYDAPVVVVQPGARYWFKAWPVERFAELVDRLAEEKQCQVLIGGSRAEIELAQAVTRLCRSRPVIIAGEADVRTFAAVLKRSALFVGNDTGAMHIAAAVGTPTVGLFGPSDPREWGPRGGPTEVLYKGLDCRACFHPTCRRGEQNCMKLIAVDEVMEAAGRLLVRSRPAFR